MIRILTLAALVALPWVAPGVLAAQRFPAAPDGRPPAAAMDPVSRILEARDELHLSAQQIEQIEKVQADLSAANAPILSRLVELRDQGSGDRRERMEAVRPLLEEVRTNNDAAMEKVQALLTDAQREAVSPFVDEAGPPPAGRRPPERP